MNVQKQFKCNDSYLCNRITLKNKKKYNNYAIKDIFPPSKENELK